MARTHQQINADRQKMHDIRSGGFGRPPEPSKAELNRMFADALRNTAAMTQSKQRGA